MSSACPGVGGQAMFPNAGSMAWVKKLGNLCSMSFSGWFHSLWLLLYIPVWDWVHNYSLVVTHLHGANKADPKSIPDLNLSSSIPPSQTLSLITHNQLYTILLAFVKPPETKQNKTKMPCILKMNSLPTGSHRDGDELRALGGFPLDIVSWGNWSI